MDGRPDKRAEDKNKSQCAETTLQACVAQLVRSQQNPRDIEIINRRTDDLNKEAEDVLAYQMKL
jgi:hypothetical protein